MYEESSAELVAHLDHPNGWWRDKAQQLLILRQDKSVANELVKMMNASTNELARIHALWTLEGLRVLDAGMVKQLMKDPNPNIRIQALRASESLYKYGEKNLEEDYRKLITDKDPAVAIQALQSAYILKVDEAEKLLQSSLQSNKTKGVQLVAGQILEKMEEAKNLSATRHSPKERELYNKGKSIFDSYCATCHGVKGLGTPTGTGGALIAPSFSGSPRIQGHPEYAVKTLLHGLTGAIEDKEYEGVMIAMDENDDQYLASVISYIRNDFGNQGSFVTPEYVAQIRQETSSRTSNYSYDELIQEIPKVMFPQDNWKVTASSTALQGVGSTKDPTYAFSYKGWRSETAQVPGMWFQIELPNPGDLTEIQFDSGEKEFPEKYLVSVSEDGNNWRKVAEGRGIQGNNGISWKDRSKAKFVRMEIVEGSENVWAMRKLRLYSR